MAILYTNIAQTLDMTRADRLLSTHTLDRISTRRSTMKKLDILAAVLVAVGGINWGLVAVAKLGLGATIGIGAAQASRQVSVDIALRRAGDRAKTAVMASDAYFPFPDGIQMAAQAGVTAIIQPGGSIRDEMAIEAADRHHLSMVFTGRRHFRH